MEKGVSIRAYEENGVLIWECQCGFKVQDAKLTHGDKAINSWSDLTPHLVEEHGFSSTFVNLNAK